jgi:hypothetical protein
LMKSTQVISVATPAKIAALTILHPSFCINGNLMQPETQKHQGRVTRKGEGTGESQLEGLADRPSTDWPTGRQLSCNRLFSINGNLT